MRLRLTAAAESIVRSGHPWVFENSIRAQNRPGTAGELGIVFDRNDKFLAVGLFDPDSPIRLRVLHTGKPVAIDDTWWARRLEEALGRRESLFDAGTTGYRLIHGENDGWPGLVVDRYDRTLVVKLYSGAWLSRWSAIQTLLAGRISCDRIVLRLSRNIQTAARAFSLADGEVTHGIPLESPVLFQENGLVFTVDVLRGQKTGFFLDQRENRSSVEGLARGRRVLNAFSFSGGFSLYAARGGATAVTSLDLSAHALESARQNFALNEGLAGCRHETVQADVFEWMPQVPVEKFGLIVVDPPSLARREAERAGALAAYGQLAGAALARLEAGGILVASSCSAHVSADEFFAAVRSAAVKARRKIFELKNTGHPPDHPATFPEAHYLKTIFLRAE